MYTIRDADTFRPIHAVATLEAAIAAIDLERAVFLLTPPPGGRTLDLVITADTADGAGSPGEIVMHHTTGQPNSFT
jgi:hypothetical protein